MLSNIYSISDRLGFVLPQTLRGKIILQLLCRDKIVWVEVTRGDITRE